MKYFYDTEFIDDGRTIEFISIGIVAEDGREYYAVTDDLDTIDRGFHHNWLRNNVMVYLPFVETNGEYDSNPDHKDYSAIKSGKQIGQDIRKFILPDPQPQLWAYFAAYDHVVLSQLFGKMIDLPVGMPMWTHDLMQEIERCKNPEVPRQLEGAHNALSDARWNKSTYDYLQSLRKVKEAVPEGFAAGPIANPLRTRTW